MVSRRRPCKISKANDMLPLTFPKVPLLKADEMYFCSKVTMRNLISYGHRPCEARGNAALQKVQAKRAKYDVDVIRYKFEQRETVAVRAHLNRQKEALRQKQTHLKKTFLKFNQFVKENSDKRERATVKLLYEKEIQDKRDEDIKLLNEDYKRLTIIKRQMEERMKNYRFYEDFLQSVAVIGGSDYKHADDLLLRYSDLIHTKYELAEKQIKTVKETEKAIVDMRKLVEQKTLEMGKLSNNLTTMYNRYDVANKKALAWETTLSAIMSYCNEGRISHLQIKSAIWGLYLQLCKRKRISPEFARSDYKHQMVFIKKAMTDFERVLYKLVPRTTKYVTLTL